MADMLWLLKSAKQELDYLRRQNELLSAQVRVVDVFAAAVGLTGKGNGAEIDLAWELQREIDKLSTPLCDVTKAAAKGIE